MSNVEDSDGKLVADHGGPATDMLLRQFAAIKLRVPDSELDWLDAMIRESRRLDHAGQAMLTLKIRENVVVIS